MTDFVYGLQHIYRLWHEIINVTFNLWKSSLDSKTCALDSATKEPLYLASKIPNARFFTNMKTQTDVVSMAFKTILKAKTLCHF